MNNSDNKGSVWSVWDLQVQTIIDDGYVSLASYYNELKEEDEEKWNEYVNKVGGEANALLFDSKEYFNDGKFLEKDRCFNYVRNMFSFIEVYAPHLKLIGFTDHNYNNNILLDVINDFSKSSNCKAICGVEINASGVHILTFFDKIPYGKSSYSDGINTFLDKIGVHNQKTNGALTVSDKSVIDVIKVIESENGIYIFAHCNSNNGLFQERGKTDRTHLSDIFNYQDVILLQGASKVNTTKTEAYILSQQLFTSKAVFSTASDSRKLLDIGKSDSNGNYFWLKGEPCFNALKQLLIEADRAFIGDEPDLLKRVRANKTKFIKSLSIDKIADVVIDDVWFDKFHIELNNGLVAIIGNKGGGKSAITDVISLCGNTHQDKENFSFLKTGKFRKAKPVNLSERFEATLTWEDGNTVTKKLSDNPDTTYAERVKYIPQNFLEKLCTNVDSDDFERELKQIIFSHTPSEKRMDKSSLDELIVYKSSLVIDEITLIKNDISRINLQIVELENRATTSYRQTIESKLEVKKNELATHMSIKPVQPQLQEVTEESAQLVLHLTSLRDKIKQLEDEINEHKTERAILIFKQEELNKALQYYRNIDEQLKKYQETTNPYVQILNKYNISSEKVFSFKIDLSDITKELDVVNNEVQKLESILDISKEDSKTFKLKSLNEQLQKDQEELDKPAKEQQKYLDAIKNWEGQKLLIEGFQDVEGSLNYLTAQLEYINTHLLTALELKYNERTNLVKKLFIKKTELIEIRKVLFLPVSKFISEFKELKEKYDVKIDVTLDLKSFPETFFNNIVQGVTGTFMGKDEGYKSLLDIIEKSSFDTEEGFVAFTNQILDSLKHDKRIGSDNKAVDINTELRKGVELSKFYDLLFSYEYLQPVYNLKLGTKTLEELSPGERGALLLIFYLILDNDDIPLIIDQPEENLDNESVYNILVHFIKKVKDKRQIIIVTHNPNLAIVCDADQIIHMQIEKENKNTVKFYSGGIEDAITNKSVINILEGTLPAFNNRDSKYLR